jgi:nucleotide-binding universal stress UspA family protein
MKHEAEKNITRARVREIRRSWAFREFAMKNLLVPIDFSDASSRVLEKASELAQELSAGIVLLHVDEPVTNFSLEGTRDIAAAWPLRSANRISDLQSRLDSLGDPLRGAGVRVKSVALVGLLIDDIVEQSTKYDAAYIILGSHGHVAAEHLFRGNLFIAILKQHAICPIIIVPV